MMSTYEIVVALFAAHSSGSSTSTVEVTTLEPKKVRVKEVDSEANATTEGEI